MPVSFSGDYKQRTRLPLGLASFDIAVAGKLEKRELGLPMRCGVHVYGATGVGKCLGEGTQILMFDGTFKKVEDIYPGEYLMGPDSLPRKVLSTTSGVDCLYEIKQKRGDNYIVNSSHILSLKFSGNFKNKYGYKHGDVINISLNDYFNFPPYFRISLKGWKTGVEFRNVPVPIDPYFLGVWLGDGSKYNLSITNNDAEVIEFLYNFANENGLKVTRTMPYDYNLVGNGHRKNSVLNKMKNLGVINNKHIPNIYLSNSSSVRYEILAGLIDTDGYLSNGCFDIVQKNKNVADGIVYLARSLGFSVKISPCKKKSQYGTIGDYFRITISGEINNIPVRVERRKPQKHLQIKNPLVCGIDVTKLGIGKYFGFELSGDGLFILKDFTVTHNTTVTMSLMGMISGLTRGNLALLPIDTFDRGMAEDIITYSGADGNVHFILEEDHNKAMMALKDEYSKKDTVATMLDSVHSVLSMAELEGDAADANMGRKAKLCSAHIKQMYHLTTTFKEDKIFFLTNLLFPNLGTLGYHTAGGMTPNSLTSIHLRLNQGYLKKKAIKFDEGRLIQGKVEKNNFGITGQQFNLFVLGGYGIHKGLTAVYDCLSYGLATEGRKIEIGGEKIASVKDMIENHKDASVFEPFINAMQDNINSVLNGNVKVEDEEAVEVTEVD